MGNSPPTVDPTREAWCGNEAAETMNFAPRARRVVDWNNYFRATLWALLVASLIGTCAAIRDHAQFADASELPRKITASLAIEGIAVAILGGLLGASYLWFDHPIKWRSESGQFCNKRRQFSPA